MFNARDAERRIRIWRGLVGLVCVLDADGAGGKDEVRIPDDFRCLAFALPKQKEFLCQIVLW